MNPNGYAVVHIYCVVWLKKMT